MSPIQRRIYLDLLKKTLTRYPFSLPEQWLMRWLAGVEAGLIQEVVRWATTGRFAGGGGAWFNPYVRALGIDFPIEADTMIGLTRLNNIEHCVADVLSRGVPGDLAETGVWRGGATIFMRGLLRAYGDTTRSVWVADSFEGLPKPDVATYPADADNDLWALPDLAVGLDDVRRNFERYGLLDDQVRFLPGWFRETLPTAPIERLAVLRLDGDLYESTIVALRALHGKVQPGGYVIIDDYGAVPACRQALDDFRTEAGITVPLRPIDWTGVYWQVPGGPRRT
jgi:O-methyltransferase